MKKSFPYTEFFREFDELCTKFVFPCANATFYNLSVEKIFRDQFFIEMKINTNCWSRKIQYLTEEGLLFLNFFCKTVMPRENGKKYNGKHD